MQVPIQPMKLGIEETTRAPDFLSDDELQLDAVIALKNGRVFREDEEAPEKFRSNPKWAASNDVEKGPEPPRTKSNSFVGMAQPHHPSAFAQRHRLELNVGGLLEPKGAGEAPAPRHPENPGKFANFQGFLKRVRQQGNVRVEFDRPRRVAPFEAVYAKMFQVKRKNSSQDKRDPSNDKQKPLAGLLGGKVQFSAKKALKGAAFLRDGGTPTKNVTDKHYNVYSSRVGAEIVLVPKVTALRKKSIFESAVYQRPDVKPRPISGYGVYGSQLHNRDIEMVEPRNTSRSKSNDSRKANVYAPSNNLYELAAGASTRVRRERIAHILNAVKQPERKVVPSHRKSRSSLMNVRAMNQDLNAILSRYKEMEKPRNLDGKNYERSLTMLQNKVSKTLVEIGAVLNRPMVSSAVVPATSDYIRDKNTTKSRQMLDSVKIGTKRHNSLERLESACLSGQRQLNRKLLFGPRTRRGYNPHDLHKKNQDSYFCKPNFFARETMHLFGVCDGHGKNGEKVAGFVAEKFPVNLADAFRQTEPLGMTTDDAYFSGLIEELMFKALKKTVTELEESDIECRFSGCTFNAAFLFQDKICVCNVGDSRAIMAYEDAPTTVYALSRDHTPYDPAEKMRIEKNNGKVSQMMDESGAACGPLRVWKNGENLPGLAMTRAIGDDYSRQIGVSWKPDMVVRQLKPGQQAIIFLSTDGVFEVMSNEDVIRITSEFVSSKNIEAACDAVMRGVLANWEAENYDVIDDITFVLVYF